MAAFGDFNILQQDDPRETEKLLSKLVKLGYESFAVNTFFTLKKTGKTKENIPCPKPTNWLQMPGIQALKKFAPKLKILSRLTVLLEEQSQAHQMATECVQAYDIIAVRPTNEKQFFQCCSTLELDVISLDMTSRLPFYLKHPQIHQAVERGVHFEIVYSPAIRDSTQRRYLISNALQLTQVARGRNIIVSSEGETEMDFRGPYDIANLGLLFGLKEDQAKAAISKNIRSVVFHAQARQGTGKSTVTGCSVNTLIPGDMWKIKQSTDEDIDSEPASKKTKS